MTDWQDREERTWMGDCVDWMMVNQHKVTGICAGLAAVVIIAIVACK